MTNTEFKRAVLDQLATLAAEQRSLRKNIDRWRAEMKAEQSAAISRDGAAKRSVAAKLMGVSGRKLEQLITAGKVKTAEDSHLVPMSEVRRYTAPKVKRERRPAVGHRARARHVDGQSDEAIADARKAMRGTL